MGKGYCPPVAPWGWRLTNIKSWIFLLFPESCRMCFPVNSTVEAFWSVRVYYLLPRKIYYRHAQVELKNRSLLTNRDWARTANCTLQHCVLMAFSLLLYVCLTRKLWMHMLLKPGLPWRCSKAYRNPEGAISKSSVSTGGLSASPLRYILSREIWVTALAIFLACLMWWYCLWVHIEGSNLFTNVDAKLSPKWGPGIFF